MQMQIILNYLREQGYRIHFCGDEKIEVNGFSSLANYRKNTLTWIKTQKAAEVVQNSAKDILVAVVQENISTNIPNVILTDCSKAVFFDILEHFFDDNEEVPNVGQGTYISPKVKLGKDVIIGHNCTLDGDIKIGDGTRIYNNVNIINTARIGKNCIIQSCVNIGHDGFAYTEDENHIKTMVKHHGGVIIGDNVYIGGSTCIERGTIDNTIIEDGAKIDVTCTIGHNSVIRKNAALVGGSVLLGSVTLEENAYIASALIKNQGHIAENALVGMGSVVTKDVEKGQVVVGVPAKPIKK
ncbi:MAG: hypothetical protein IJJ01_09650 [Firmicutes bacterium]|nr:hypothetical protein [Bacillota bacterium]